MSNLVRSMLLASLTPEERFARAQARAFAAIRRGAREATHYAIVTAIRQMTTDEIEFDRIEPGLSDMPIEARLEHCRELWQAAREEAVRLARMGWRANFYPRVDLINLRAAYVAAWLLARYERRMERERRAAA